MSEINANIRKKIKINKNCTCCYVNKGWRCMWEQYNYNDLKEVYGKMIMECFALSWDLQSHEMICESCVLRLREALKLKIEFLAVQELLQDESILQLEDEKPNSNKKHSNAEKVIKEPYICLSNHDTVDVDNNSMSDSETISNDQLCEKNEHRIEKGTVLAQQKTAIEIDDDYECLEVLDTYLHVSNYDTNCNDNSISDSETISNHQLLTQLEKEKPKDPTTNEMCSLDDLSHANVRAQEVTILKIYDEYNCFEGSDTHDVSRHDAEDINYSMSDSETISNYQPARKPGKKKSKKGTKRHYRSTYTFSDLQNAIKAVKAKEMTILKASQTYGVPKKTLSSKLNADTEVKDEERGLMQEKNFKLYDEIQTILQYTNALPFKSKTGKYYCAYCSTDGPFFEEPRELRQHTRSTHGAELTARVPHIMKPSTLNEILRMEITDLRCTACNTELDAWNDMLVHFFEAHEIRFDEACTRVIPYSLSDELKCALCSAAFLNFGLLDAHMNAHYCNYICYDCGDTFLANGRLENHLKIHDVGTYPCDRCGKTFTRELYRARHVSLVHDHLPQVKCRYCPEKFRGTFARHRHVLERHPATVREMACEVCDKKFTWKRYYLDHMRRAHSKNYTCSKCNVSFTKKLSLRAHLTEKAEMNDPVHA